MIDSKFASGALKTTTGLLLAGVMWLSLTAATTKTVSKFTDTAQQLEGVATRNWYEWPWSVGGQSASLADDSETDLVYELNNDADKDLEIQTRSQEWLHLNRGDGSKGFVRTPIVQF